MGLHFAGLLVVALASCRFYLAAAPFRRQAPLACRRVRFCRPALFRPPGRVLEQRRQPGARRFTILRLRAMFAAVDDEDAIARQATAGERDEAALDVIG